MIPGPSPYNCYHVTGPYIRQTGSDIGRKFMAIRHLTNGRRTTVALARFLLETHLNRKLSEYEHVHHINGDKTDDRLENLRILNSDLHCKLHHPKLHSNCIEKCAGCGADVSLTATQFRKLLSYKKRGGTGPYCNRSCIGKYAIAFRDF